MKKVILAILLSITTILSASAARQGVICGRVVDSLAQPIPFATAVLQQNGQQTAGTITDNDGRFTLAARTGRYTLTIQIVGYKPYTRELTVDYNADLGDIVLSADRINIEAVTVTSRLITRQADRFVVDVANSNQAIGKTGEELLKMAPGVWITNGKISVNGTSGTKIFINEREMRMTDEELLTYLRTIGAENIQKIEVIPQTGSDYDADSKGGVIKITLRRHLNDGISGTASLNTRFNEYEAFGTVPRFRLEYNKNKFSLNTEIGLHYYTERITTREFTTYTTRPDTIRAHSALRNTEQSYWIGLGAVYDINDRNSIGIQTEYFFEPPYSYKNKSMTDVTGGASTTHNTSVYSTTERYKKFSATANYIHKTDTLGSTLKVIADYLYRTRPTKQNYEINSLASGITADTTYRNLTESEFSVAVLSLDYEKIFNPKVTLKTGL